MKSEKNFDSTVQKDIEKFLKKGVSDHVFPCGAVGILQGLGKEKKKMIKCYGNASLFPEKRKLKMDFFFDLASLTKPFATTMAILCLMKMQKIGIDETLSSLLERKIDGEKKNITLEHLLSHCSGFPAHRDYFKILKDIPEKKKRKYVETLLLEEHLEYSPGTKALYSDLGFMLLGLIIEKKAGHSLDYFVYDKVFKPFHLEKNIFFIPLSDNKEKKRKREFVATENCPWRKKILCGEVHDDNCFAMGGIAGHSGLFGDIESVTRYVGLILDMWKNAAVHPNIKNSDLINFLVRNKKKSPCNKVLGFDRRDTKYSSSGKYFSERSVGHLGFSGTSFWIDPDKEIVIVLLSNRIHPSRTNTKIKKFRPVFHDKIMERIFPVLKKNKKFLWQGQ
jgi:CubicO group peptidase (beta-lactamase class C family)